MGGFSDQGVEIGRFRVRWWVFIRGWRLVGFGG